MTIGKFSDTAYKGQLISRAFFYSFPKKQRNLSHFFALSTKWVKLKKCRLFFLYQKHSNYQILWLLFSRPGQNGNGKGARSGLPHQRTLDQWIATPVDLEELPVPHQGDAFAVQRR